jgi:hypothetical protein
MQLAADASLFYKAGDYVDTIKGSGVQVRILFDKFEGSAMLHCHVLRHEDQGLMGHIWVRNSSEDVKQSNDGAVSRARISQNSAATSWMHQSHQSSFWTAFFVFACILMI